MGSEAQVAQKDPALPALVRHLAIQAMHAGKSVAPGTLTTEARDLRAVVDTSRAGQPRGVEQLRCELLWLALNGPDHGWSAEVAELSRRLAQLIGDQP